MNYFLDTEFSEEQLLLNEEESKHALRSLRMQIGDKLIVGDGAGTRYTCEITGVHNIQAQLKIIDKETKSPSPNPLSIAIAPTKNASRFEWFLEKATELGVHEILPIDTKYSERPRINEKRAKKIILSASKQSQRFFIPRLEDLKAVKDLLLDNYDHVLIAHCVKNSERIELSEELKKLSGSCLIMIGPEGDFSDDEISFFSKRKAVAISLGENRLRTETAGVYSAALYAALVH